MVSHWCGFLVCFSATGSENTSQFHIRLSSYVRLFLSVGCGFYYYFINLFIFVYIARSQWILLCEWIQVYDCDLLYRFGTWCMSLWMFLDVLASLNELKSARIQTWLGVLKKETLDTKDFPGPNPPVSPTLSDCKGQSPSATTINWRHWINAAT